MFSGGIERNQWHEVGYKNLKYVILINSRLEAGQHCQRIPDPNIGMDILISWKGGKIKLSEQRVNKSFVFEPSRLYDFLLLRKINLFILCFFNIKSMNYWLWS